jgi:hypothetical protein
MAYWFIRHPSELLLDLDDAGRRTRSGAPWIEVFFRRRLRDAIAAGRLKVREVWLVRSNSPHHYSAFIRLLHPMPPLEALVWQLHLGSDLYRGRADLMRLARGQADTCSLLIFNEDPQVYRRADYVCACRRKHKTEDRPDCAVWRKLRGSSPWELFGPSSQAVERGVPLPLGRVPLSLIMEVRL